MSSSSRANRRVWVVSELYYPELTSTGYFLTGIAEGLAEAGWDIGVLTAQPGYWERGQKAPRYELRNGVRIWRSRGTLFNKDRLVGRIINQATISVALCASFLRKFEVGETVIVVTNPPLLPYMAVIAAHLKGAQVVLLVHDVYPEVLYRLGMISPASAAAKVLNWCARWLTRSVKRVLVLGRDMRDLVLEKNSPLPNAVVIATNWANTHEITPQPRAENALLKSLGLESKFIVQFYGNMGRPHGIEDLIRAAELLRDNRDIHLLLVGWGAKKEWAVEQCRRLDLDNVTVMDPLPRARSRDVQNACDVSINTLASGMTGVSVPSRTYNVMAAGKPLIAVCEDDSELAMTVREDEIGWIVPPKRPELLAAAIRTAMINPSLRAEMGIRAYRACHARYTREHVIGIYDKVLRELNFLPDDTPDVPRVA